MKFNSRGAAHVWLALLILLPVMASAQTLNITSGVQTYASLASTTVNLSNRCELRVTNAATPITGCIINLTSPDTACVLLNVKPSTVVSTYLSQFRVNGAAAVVDSNCRVVQYAMGAIVVPHAPSLQPLTVYSGPHFTGSSMALSQYTYYKSGLGAMYANISSFRLKRGYMAVMAQTENGTGISKSYVAQDGDMEISVLPSDFDNSVRFVYVLPWRWASKKGIAGNIESGLNLQWKYNWNLDQNSTRDLEYVPIRQQRWWPSLSQNWQTRGANTLLGYNEPDKADQANLAVGDAIYSWPDLLGTGLRLGAPAVSDGGRSGWLYPFMEQADAANLRVDFVPVHYYWCFNPADPAGAANQFYNFLKATYDQVKRPLWITEWNNGANWTGCGDPTSTQQQAAIAAILDMLDSTPFVERYALYNWVEDVRRVQWDDGSLTAAGVTYRDKASPLAYLQALQSNGTRSFAQLRFDTNTLDSSGYGNNGITSGTPAYTNGYNGQALVFDGSNTVATLPPNIANNTAFSFAAWVNWGGGVSWQRLFDFGNSPTHYMFLSPNAAGTNLRFAMRNGGGEQTVQTVMPPVGTWQHVAVTLSGTTARIYTNGVLAAQNTGMSITPANFSPRVNTLGRSQFPADPLFKGLLDDVLITDYALSAAQIAALLTNTPPQFTSNLFTRPVATEGTPYSDTIAGMATDADLGDTLTYSKAIGPAWLSVAADGTLSGAPTSADGGTNFFTVRATDAAGQSAFALLTIPVTITTASGTWAVNADGNWGLNNRWSGNVVATGAGQTANFSTLNISGHRTVTLDSARSIGTLRFSDTAATFFNWTITNSSGSTLTLNTGSGVSPTVAVTNTATIAAPLAGTNGFTKSGPGTLVLRGENPLSGTVYIDTGSTTADDGEVSVVGPGALANAALISIRNNNSGNSTLQIDGSSGSVTINAPITATYRNNSVVTLQNLSGTNILNGNLMLYQGGNSFTVQADAGSLVVFTGTNQYVGDLTGTRTNYFTGPGSHLLIAPIINSTNGSPISLAKSGTGTLTLEAVNTYGNGTLLSGGTLIVNGSLPAGSFNISGSTTLGGNGIINPAVTLPSSATLAPGNKNIGTLTANNNVTLQAGSITRLEINKTAGSNDQLRVLGTLTYGGTLVVTNLSGTLWAGDSFHLFDPTSTSSAFAVTNLPVLANGLVWEFNGSSGILRVAEPDAPGVPPVAPTALAAVGGDAVVNLTWVQSATAGAVYNQVYRSASGIGGPFNPLATVPAYNSYADTTAVNGQTYHYVVTAISTNGESAWSGYASATPRAFEPYAADADTLHLWHFDELATPCVDSAAGGTNLTYMIGGASLGNASAAGSFANAISFGTLTTSNAVIFPTGSGSVGAAIPFTYAGADGAFTYEAVAQVQFNPAAFARNQPSQILNCDANGTGTRVFQFRLLPPGTVSGSSDTNIVRIEFINGTTTAAIVPVPTTGADAIVSNAWYHVAVTYDGAANTTSNLLFYWTRMGSSRSAANCIAGTNLTADLPGTSSATTIVSIGNSARNPGGGTGPAVANFLGKIDEVRISRVARAATNFFWQPVAGAPEVPQDLSAAPSYGQAQLGWSLVTDAVSYNIKRVATNGASFHWLTNVTSTAFVDLGLAEATTYYYVVSAVNSAGESANSLPVSVTLPVLSPPSLTNSLAGGTLTLSWPTEHTGWSLQSNSVSLVATDAWFTVPGSTATNQMSFDADQTATNVFFRLSFP